MLDWFRGYISHADADSSVINWMLFLTNEFSTLFWRAMWLTLWLAVVGTVAGYLLGFAVGVARDAAPGGKFNPFRIIVTTITRGYIEIFRGTPMIVQGMVIYFGLRQSGIDISSTNAGILVMLLNTGAYMAETVRGGLNAIHPGQKEGALAIGLSPLKTMIFVIFPQAIKNIMPEMGNVFILNLKMTSVLSVIRVTELFHAARMVGSIYFRYFEAYLIIAVIYLVMCLFFAQVMLRIEKKVRTRKPFVLASEYIDT